MRTAVVHVDAGALPENVVADGIRELERQGFTLHRRPAPGELELLVDSASPHDARDRTTSACAAVFGTAPAIRAVTFISRGTDEDALGVVEAFGLSATLTRTEEDGEEVATFTLPAADRRKVPESRLHTALEAALNCEVRLEFA